MMNETIDTEKWFSFNMLSTISSYGDYKILLTCFTKFLVHNLLDYNCNNWQVFLN